MSVASHAKTGPSYTWAWLSFRGKDRRLSVNSSQSELMWQHRCNGPCAEHMADRTVQTHWMPVPRLTQLLMWTCCKRHQSIFWGFIEAMESALLETWRISLPSCRCFNDAQCNRQAGGIVRWALVRCALFILYGQKCRRVCTVACRELVLTKRWMRVHSSYLYGRELLSSQSPTARDRSPDDVITVHSFSSNRYS